MLGPKESRPHVKPREQVLIEKNYGAGYVRTNDDIKWRMDRTDLITN